MPEPAPDPDGKKLLDSAIIEQDYDSLPGLCNIEREDPVETPAEEESPAESATSEPPPPPESPAPPADDQSPCNQMQHDFEICEDVASAPAPRRPRLHSCPVPPAVPKIEDLENIENDDAPQPATRHPNAKLVEECP
jgi:hypothetical protein